ncbi:agamous-like MADS-box protein AGL62 [Durio zibethinus]|uniref:Agamous-like MADS-box protein AGL62 n=1 Tax=Durio zibethinus TaxID=66656 RepID=A0A6P6ABJ7_DURZI|nr:agamous-like MADS-box protein AGL62 [Durio zibethinus]
MGKKCLGRQKVEMEKIKNESNLQVTFSKRRSGLFKKASELCTLCGTEIGILAFSPGNKVFSFGHPDVGTVVDRYLSSNPPETSATSQLIEAHRNVNVRELNMHLTEVVSQLEAERIRAEKLNQMSKASQNNQNWWGARIEELSLPQLQRLKSSLGELKKNVTKQAEKLLIQSANSQQLFMGSSSAGVHPNYETKNFAFDANMMPQGYSAPHLIPPGYSPNPEGYYPNPHGYCPGPPGFGRGFF